MHKAIDELIAKIKPVNKKSHITYDLTETGMTLHLDDHINWDYPQIQLKHKDISLDSVRDAIYSLIERDKDSRTKKKRSRATNISYTAAKFTMEELLKK